MPSASCIRPACRSVGTPRAASPRTVARMSATAQPKHACAAGATCATFSSTSLVPPASNSSAVGVSAITANPSA